jgi:two-component system chemotaxis response regulator CheY
MPNISSKPSRVIIVDDSSTFRSLLNGILTSDGFEVVAQLSGGKLLLQSIAKMAPDVVCLDINLPDCNGIDLLKSLSSEHPNVAVVMITGDTNPDLQNVAAECGAAGFIHKPLSHDQVSKVLSQIIHMQSLLANVSKLSGLPNEEDAKVPVRSTAIIVDDSNATRLLLAAVLAQDGIEVIGQATNGLQATEMVSQLRPDLVCLDIVMPVMDGMSALKQILNTDPATKVVMITSNSSRDIVMNSLKAGALDFIVKPFDVEKVSDVITRVLNS